jgi:hypothetical protein
MEREPSRFPPSFAPRRPRAGRRTSGRGQAIEHGPGTTLTASAEPPIMCVHSWCATSRRTARSSGLDGFSEHCRGVPSANGLSVASPERGGAGLTAARSRRLVGHVVLTGEDRCSVPLLPDAPPCRSTRWARHCGLGALRAIIPVAEAISGRWLSMPVGPSVTIADRDDVVAFIALLNR